MLVILGALIPLLQLAGILFLNGTRRITQLTHSSHNLKFDTVITDANNSNLEGYS